MTFIQSVTSFWPMKFDLILTCTKLTSFWFIKFDLILTCDVWPHLPVMVWPDVDLQLFDLILTCNDVTWFWPIMFDLILTCNGVTWFWHIWRHDDLYQCSLSKALVRPWHKWLHVWCPLGPVSQDWETCKKSDDVNGVLEALP